MTGRPLAVEAHTVFFHIKSAKEKEETGSSQIKFVSILFISPTVYDAVREGHQTMSNMENYNDACAMAAPWNTPTIKWTGSQSPARGQNCSGLDMHRHHDIVFRVSVCACVCACVIKNVSLDEKHTKWFSVPQKV